MGRTKKIRTLNGCSVVYNDIEHTYTLNGKEINGITGMLHSMLFQDMYNNIPKAVLDKAAERGSEIHEEVSMYESAGIDPKTPEAIAYVTKIKPLLDVMISEYLVTDNENFASEIDIVAQSKGKAEIYDIKTWKSGITPEKKEYVRWQLSCYAYMFGLQNPDVEVSRIGCIWLCDDKAEIIYVDLIDSDTIKSLLSAYVNGLPFCNPFEQGLVEETDAMREYISFEKEYLTLTARIKELDELKSKVMESISQVLEQIDSDTVETEHLKFTKVSPSTRVTIDSAKLKKERPDVYDEYKKVSNVKGSIRVTLKKDEA